MTLQIYNNKNIFEDVSLQIDHRTKLVVEKGFESFKIKYCKNTLSKFTTKNCIFNHFSIDYLYYESINQAEQLSGAYVFRPSSQAPVKMGSPYKLVISKGDIITELTISRLKPNSTNNEVVTKMRFYKDNFERGIDIETTLFHMDLAVPTGQPPIRGKEAILKVVSSTLDNRNVFYTDANGMEMMERVLNYRSDLDVNVLDNFDTGNYYPVNSAIYIEDNQSGDRMTLMNDRAQGGSSLEKGSIELMIHRKIDTDDGRGVNEFLAEHDTENLPITIKTNHKLIFSNNKKRYASYQRNSQYRNDNPLFTLYSSTNLYQFKTGLEIGLFEDNLPESVKMAIRSYNEDEYIVRFHNLDDSKNTSFYLVDSKNNNFILTQFLQQSITIISKNISELSLSTNQLRSQVLENKYRFREFSDLNLSQFIETNFSLISLRPQEIRTFLISGLQKIEGRISPPLIPNFQNSKEEPLNDESDNLTDEATVETKKDKNSTNENSTNENVDSNESLSNSSNTSNDTDSQKSKNTFNTNDPVDNLNSENSFNKSLNFTQFIDPHELTNLTQNFNNIIDIYSNNYSEILVILTIVSFLLLIFTVLTIRLLKKMKNNTLGLQKYEKLNDNLGKKEIVLQNSPDMIM